MIFFSPARQAFYDDSVHETLPGDALAITAERHAEMLEAQSAGLAIVSGPNGLPVAQERPAPSSVELLADMRRQRDDLLRATDATQVADYPISDEERAAWQSYRQALRDLPKTFTDPAAIEWPTPPAFKEIA